MGITTAGDNYQRIKKDFRKNSNYYNKISRHLLFKRRKAMD